MKGYAIAPLENFTFRKVTLQARHAGTIDYVRNLRVEKVCISAHDNQPLRVVHAEDLSGEARKCPNLRKSEDIP